MSAPPQPDPAARVWMLMQAFVDAHSPRHALRRKMPQLGRGRTKLMMLISLADGPASLGELADAHGVDRPYATLNFDQLEALGLVQRTADPDDRRRKLVVLTDDGRAAVAGVQEIMATPPPELGQLPASDLAELEAAFHRLLGR